MSLKVAVVVGNPKPASRTRKIAELLVDKLLAMDLIMISALVLLG